jgi:hypothetical protein
MVKNVNTTFLKSLIDSDFAIVSSSKNQNHLKSKIKINSLYNFNILNILELNKTLKQFSRLLLFLKQQKRTEYCIYILVEDKYLNVLLTTIFQELSITLPIVISEALPIIKSDSEKINVMLILGNLSYNYKDIVENKLFFNKIFLINKFNTKSENAFNGIYKIYNDINDFKKIIFLVVLMSKILNKNININAKRK